LRYNTRVNLLDAAILLLIIGLAIRGLSAGILRQVGSLGGFGVGMLAGAVLAPLAANYAPAGVGHVAVLLFVFFTVAVTVGGIGEAIGNALAKLAERGSLKEVDGVFGAVFGLAAGLAAAWLLSSTFSRTAGPFMIAQIQTSRILRVLDANLPPAPDVLSRLESYLGTAGFPRVFVGLEPAPAPPVTGPNAAAVNAAAAAAQAATVRIESPGCAGLLEGSGFVVGDGLVATNAHVVAGAQRIIVRDARGPHVASVVVFDPNRDFAVLRTSGLAAAPLTMDAGVEPRGTVGAVVGYPGGGGFTVSPAAVLGSQVAIGRNIYGTGLIRRHIYELQAVVRPGNSGGPLVAPDGRVLGVIFAMSTTNDQLGYALTADEVRSDIARAEAQARAVSTGPCIAD
jgi:S1-C subfamily serine protease